MWYIFINNKKYWFIDIKNILFEQEYNPFINFWKSSITDGINIYYIIRDYHEI